MMQELEQIVQKLDNETVSRGIIRFISTWYETVRQLVTQL